jgi:hypothetical protein
MDERPKVEQHCEHLEDQPAVKDHTKVRAADDQRLERDVSDSAFVAEFQSLR